MDNFVSRGEDLEIPAQAWNDLLSMLGWWRRKRGERAQTPYIVNDRNIIDIRNNSGGTRARFDILGIGDSRIDPTEEVDDYKFRTVFNGVEPTYPNYFAHWAMLLSNVPNGEVGKAIICGQTSALVQVIDEHFEYADIVFDDEADDQYKLVTSDVGFAKVLHLAPEPIDGSETVYLATIDIGNHNLTRRFELKTSLNGEDGADAYPIFRDTVNGDYRRRKDADDEFMEFRVYRGINFRIFGAGESGTYRGEFGEAHWCRDSRQWEAPVLDCERQTKEDYPEDEGIG